MNIFYSNYPILSEYISIRIYFQKGLVRIVREDGVRVPLGMIVIDPQGVQIERRPPIVVVVVPPSVAPARRSSRSPPSRRCVPVVAVVPAHNDDAAVPPPLPTIGDGAQSAAAAGAYDDVVPTGRGLSPHLMSPPSSLTGRWIAVVVDVGRRITPDVDDADVTGGGGGGGRRRR
jgi:hypothetical protein